MGRVWRPGKALPGVQQHCTKRSVDLEASRKFKAAQVAQIIRRTPRLVTPPRRIEMYDS